MGINQAIFTSSARGINKGGGLGIHTYSRECSAIELSEFEQSYCNYVYHGKFDKISELPTKMVYGKVGADRYMQAEITYLGMDYDKVSGRTGNYLSHMFSFTKDDMKCYPMQYYDSPDYRRIMKTEEVDGTLEVDYLPVLDAVRPGKLVNIDRIQEFLGAEDFRMDFFCHMLAAVIGSDQIHKVIICDKHENIVMWIAAIQYALPLQCVREMSFSTYEYNPIISEFDIRGAVPELSEGTCEDYSASGQFYVFDGIGKAYPKFDISSDFYQYGIQMAMSYAYDSLKAFHDFLKSYSYIAVDQDMYDGFKLFQMMQGGMEALNGEEFNRAISFERKYGSKKSYRKMLSNLVERLESSADIEKHVVDNIRMLLVGYYGKKLNPEEFWEAVSLTITLEKLPGTDAGTARENRTMWKELYAVIDRYYPEYDARFADCLIQHDLFPVLGGFCTWMLTNGGAENLTAKVEEIYGSYWGSVPAAQRKHFDAVVLAAAKMLKDCEDEDRDIEIMNLFLKLQTLGNGEIAGPGMEQLICMIADSVSLCENRRTVPALRKKDGDKVIVNLQTRCAFETYNYTQRNGVELPIAVIRLKHLGRCIEKAYEAGTELSKSKSLALYTEYPVYVDYVDREEFSGFIRQLCKTVFEYENSKEDFIVLMTCWILNEHDKQMLMAEFVDHEIPVLKKQEQGQEFAEMLAAVKELGDSEYRAALERIVSELKNSLREKITDIMEESPGRKSDAFAYWRKLNRKAENMAENAPKKSILNFRRNK